jgi:UDP-N-acetylmuramoyl-tripeptide--D-alanyl-D-alanine ligase
MIAGKLRDYIAALGSDVAYLPADLDREFTGISIDSRTTKTDNIFVCVPGEKHDGHDFIKQAVAAGAAAIIASRDRDLDQSVIGTVPVIRVRDTLRSLGDLARDYLRRINPRKVAVTGTNGKTTSKNMITAVLKSSFATCSSTGNFNNLYGVPLSIFDFARSCKVAVLEFGMSTPGEIARLVEIVDPDVRVILNIGPAHLQSMKSIDAIADAKFEMLSNCKSDDWAVLNFDDPLIKARSQSYSLQKLSFGTSAGCEVLAHKIHSNGSGHTHFDYLGVDIRVPLLGRHHLLNCLSAIAVAEVFDVAHNKIKAALESFKPEGFRMATEVINGVTIINDAYNANPTSMAAALETMSELAVTGKRIAVLGDMLELGDDAPRYHAELGARIAANRCDLALVTGEFSSVVRDSAVKAGMAKEAIAVIDDQAEIVSRLADTLRSGDLLLVKASRALELENVVESLRPLVGRRN